MEAVVAGDREFDVVIVGARCAGAPLALDLAKRGLRVCLVDRARFPSEVPSTHLIHPNGVSRLAELGLLRQLLATGAPPLVAGSFTLEDVTMEMPSEVEAGFEAPWLCIRRVVLDELLIEAAAEGGVEVLTETAVDGLVMNDGVVRGVRVKGQELRAHLVVGADGPHSTIARLVRADTYHRTLQGRVFLWGYFEEGAVPEGHSYLGAKGELGFISASTDSGLFMAGVGVPKNQRGSYLRDTEAGLRRGLGQVGELGEYVRPFPLVGPVRAMTRWEGFFREATGPGWVLVGDAGHFKDPTPGQGISDALRQGKKLAGVIEAGLGLGRLEERLHQWWRWRDEDAWEMYWLAADMGSETGVERVVVEMFRRLTAEPGGAARFLRVLNHELRPSEVFTTGAALSAFLRASASNPRGVPRFLHETGQLAKQDFERHRWGRKLGDLVDVS